MTPKEAIIRKELEKLTDTHYEPQRTEYIDSAMEVIKQVLTSPPTVDEVCKALSEHYKEQVSYSNESYKHLFYFEKSKLRIVLLRYGIIYFYQNDYHKTNYLPPHLVTLIGRFYEGLEVKE